MQITERWNSKLVKVTGLTFKQHVDDLKEEVAGLEKAYPALFTSYNDHTGESLHDALYAFAELHDLGKVLPTTQSLYAAAHSAYKAIRDTCVTRKHRARASDTAFASKIRGKQPARHELMSLVFALFHLKISLADAVTVAVAASHDKLTRGEYNGAYLPQPNCPEKMKVSLKNGLQNLWRLLQEIETDRMAAASATSADAFTAALAVRRQFDVVRSLSQAIDHRASARADGGAFPELTAPALVIPTMLRPIQELSLKCLGLKVAVLIGPCGSGKTNAYVLSADEAIRAGRRHAMTVLLPTRTTSNAVASQLKTKAWHGAIAGTVSREWASMASRCQFAINVMTVDQAVLASLGKTEADRARWAMIINSKVILDEVEAYDNWTQGSIARMLDSLLKSGGEVLIGSATCPRSLIRFYERQTQETIPVFALTEKEDPTLAESRWKIRLHGSYYQPVELKDKIIAAMRSGTFGVFCNTIANVHAYKRLVRKIQRENADLRSVPVIFLHSEMTAPDRHAAETMAGDLLGADAWRENRAKGVLLTTQVAERSVDVCVANAIIEECPMDSLTQRLGRVGRHFPQGSAPASVLVVRPCHDEGQSQFNSWPYMSRTPRSRNQRGDKFAVSDALTRTRAILTEGLYSHSRLSAMVEEVYVNEFELDEDAQANAALFNQYVIDYPIILPPKDKDAASTDDLGDEVRGQAGDFLVRSDTSPSNVVYVSLGDAAHRKITKGERIALGRTYGVPYRQSKIEKAIKNGWITSVSITISQSDKRADQTDTVWLVDPRALPFRMGHPDRAAFGDGLVIRCPLAFLPRK